MIEIFFCPPIENPSFSVELTALIVKAMADLMSDNSAHRAVVVRGVGIHIKEWRLENRCRKIQCILQGKIECIYDLRVQPPFVAIHRFPQLCELLSIII